MDYLKIYCKMIRKFEARTYRSQYTDSHHVFPKSVYGENERVVDVTYREHYLLHALAEKAAEQRYGKEDCRTITLNRAFWRMNTTKYLSHGRGKAYSNIVLYNACKGRLTANKETRAKQSISQTGRKHSEETKKKISLGNRGLQKKHKGRKQDPDFVARRTKNLKGIVRSQSTKDKLKSVKRKKAAKDYKLTSPTGNVEFVYMGLTEIGEYLGCSKHSVFHCLNGKNKTFNGGWKIEPVC